ncbi:MAG: hypothetical protein AAB558_02370 [Patescibacteria group bacterium]
MESNQPASSKQPMSSWFLLGAMVLIVGGLLTVWVVRYDDTMAADRANGESANLPVSDFKGGLGYLGQVWDERTKAFSNFFGSQVEQAGTDDGQNQGQVGQLTNAGLTNEQIETIEQDLFENVAPQD